VIPVRPWSHVTGTKAAPGRDQSLSSRWSRTTYALARRCPDPTETFRLWDFTGDVTALKGYGFANPPTAADAAAIREDLRSGISYGSTVISQPAGGLLSSITITLDPEAIAAINSMLDSANLLFAIGGFSDTLTGQQLLFQSSGGGPNIARLDVVPVPIGDVGLPGMVMALGGIIALARRRRKAAA